jgi:SAM-dependent methyltransferase
MRLFYSYDNYPYAACLDCGTWYVPHRVTDAVIEDFLSKVPEARLIADRMMRGRDEGSRTADRARFTRYFEMLRPLLRGHRATRYLDIGCGVGHSIEVAGELGMRATGVELSEVAVRTARAKGRNVLLPAEQDAGATYELISLFETLEHIADPGETLSAAKASLATGGAIFVTVPNRACWEISSLRERCFHVYGGTDGAGHINLFDVDGLGRLFSRHGLSLVYADSEYGSDALQVFGQFLKARKPVPDMVGQAPVGLQLPDTMFTLLNATGPALSLLERVLIRSPILIAIACRQEDVERLQPVITEMEASRRARLLELLDSV